MFSPFLTILTCQDRRRPLCSCVGSNGELLDVSHGTERLYRGYCHPVDVMEYVRKEFLAKEES